MKQLFIGSLLWYTLIVLRPLCVAADQPPTSPAPNGMSPTSMFRGSHLDASLGVGYRLTDSDHSDNRLATRIRVGYLRTRDPWFLGLGASVETGGTAAVSVGPYLTVTHYITGFHGSISARATEDIDPLLEGELGWSLASIRLQWIPTQDTNATLILGLSIPFGIATYGGYPMDRDIYRRSRHPSP